MLHLKMFDRILNIPMSGMATATQDIVSQFLNHSRITNTELYLGACKISMIESFLQKQLTTKNPYLFSQTTPS